MEWPCGHTYLTSLYDPCQQDTDYYKKSTLQRLRNSPMVGDVSQNSWCRSRIRSTEVMPHNFAACSRFMNVHLHHIHVHVGAGRHRYSFGGQDNLNIQWTYLFYRVARCAGYECLAWVAVAHASLIYLAFSDPLGTPGTKIDTDTRTCTGFYCEEPMPKMDALLHKFSLRVLLVRFEPVGEMTMHSSVTRTTLGTTRGTWLWQLPQKKYWLLCIHLPIETKYHLIINSALLSCPDM